MQKLHVDCEKPNTCSIASCFMGGDTAFRVVDVVTVEGLDDDDGWDDRVVVRVGVVTTFAMIGVVCVCMYLYINIIYTNNHTKSSTRPLPT
jgi:phage shock protein PspC (stress-responsive transcriptional regulator)